MSDPQRPPSRQRVIGEGIAWTSVWSLRWLLIAAGAVVLGLVVRETWSILLPVLLGLVVATILSPVAGALTRWLRLPRVLASGLAVGGLVALVVGIGAAIAPSVGGQVTEIASNAVGGLQEVQDWVQRTDFISASQVDTVLQAAQDRISSSAGVIAAGLVTGVSAVTHAVVVLVVTLVLAFFFVKDGHRFLPWLRELAGPQVGGHLEQVLSRAWRTLGAFIRTQALVSLIDAVLIGLGLVLVGVPLAVPLAIVTFFGGFVPIVGAFVAGGIAVLVALVSNGPVGALIIFAVILAVQQLEGNVLSPWLQSESTHLHPAVVLLSVTLGSTLFGAVGAFLAVPVSAVAAVVLRYLDEVVRARTDPSVTPPGPAPADAEGGDTESSEPLPRHPPA